MRRWICVLVPAVLLACSGEASSPSDGAAADHVVPADGSPVVDAPLPGGETAPPRDLGTPDGPPATSYDGVPGELTKTAAGRTYRLLVPAGYTHAAPIPLVVAFHGAGDDGANFYAVCKYVGWAAAAAPASFILLVPDTKSPYKDFAVWSGNPMNDFPQMKQEMAEIIAIIDETAKHYNVDKKQIHALGFSDGGLFVAVAGMARADYFASLAVAGYGWGGSYPGGTPSRKIAVQLVVGSNDQFASYAQSSEAFLKSNGHPTRIQVASGVGHSFIGLMQAYPPGGVFAWMKQHPL